MLLGKDDCKRSKHGDDGFRIPLFWARIHDVLHAGLSATATGERHCIPQILEWAALKTAAPDGRAAIGVSWETGREDYVKLHRYYKYRAIERFTRNDPSECMVSQNHESGVRDENTHLSYLTPAYIFRSKRTHEGEWRQKISALTPFDHNSNICREYSMSVRL